MNWIVKIIVSSLAVMLVSYLLPGVTVEDYAAALWVAFALSILNSVLKPILILLTIPATILSLGLFLFVINAGIILIADYLLSGFGVDGFWWALLFSLLLSVVTSILESSTKKKRKER
ncbi:MAG: putative membrane protein [Bacteroidia bacterium]|jgi:putative membrane protein